MQRPIKFRAWDTINQTMYPVEQWANKSWIAVPVQTGEEEWELSQRRLKDVYLMQFTGLLDKSGKEIWEGDVVQWSNDYTVGKRRNRKAVQWVNGYQRNGWNLLSPRSKNTEAVNHYEVIGNVWENPELLK